MHAGPGAELGLPADRAQGSRDSGHIWGHGCSCRGQWPAAGPTADRGADVTRGFAQLLVRVSRWQRATELQGDMGGGAQVSRGGPLTEQVSRRRVFTNTWHTHTHTLP